MEPVGVTARSANVDAPRQAGSRPAVRLGRAGNVLAAAACLIALVAVLAVRAGESAHPIVKHHAVVMTAGVDQPAQLRGSHPLAVAAPNAVSATLVARAAEVAAEPVSESIPISSVRTRGPPGTV
jgi:hypothetical protein